MASILYRSDAQSMLLWGFSYYGKTIADYHDVECNKSRNTKRTVNRRWGWLAFNSGSTYGVTGDRWQYAARAAVATMIASMGGGLIGLGFSLTNPNGIDILSQINGILGSLVAVTGTYLVNIENMRKLS